MEYSIEYLPASKWKGHPLPIDYTTSEHYGVTIEHDEDGFRVGIKKLPFPEPMRFSSEMYDFPDKLYEDYRPNAKAHGVLIDGELVAAIETEPEEWSNRLRVNELWIAEPYRRQGIGHALMEHAKSETLSGGYRALMLETQTCNVNAVGFYLREGLTLIGFDACCYTNRDLERGEVRLELGWFPKAENSGDSDSLARITAHKHGIRHAEIIDRYNPDSPRLIYKLRADGKTLILKGIPDTVAETIIEGNVSAHEFLGAYGLAPALIRFPDGSRYVREGGFWFYMFEFVDGETLTDSDEDERALGALSRRLHSLGGYTSETWFDGDRAPYYEKYHDRAWKSEFDRLLDGMPEFRTLAQCFIHSDIGPHNAMRKKNGDVVFIDLDDSGTGCRYLDLGYPFIMQYVQNGNDGSFGYNFDAAISFLRGYYGDTPPSREEYDLVWQGAVFMHISYMDVWGPDAVERMWHTLQYGLSQKEALWERISEAWA